MCRKVLVIWDTRHVSLRISSVSFLSLTGRPPRRVLFVHTGCMNVTSSGSGGSLGASSYLPRDFFCLCCVKTCSPKRCANKARLFRCARFVRTQFDQLSYAYCRTDLRAEINCLNQYGITVRIVAPNVGAYLNTPSVRFENLLDIAGWYLHRFLLKCEPPLLRTDLKILRCRKHVNKVIWYLVLFVLLHYNWC